MNEAGTASVNQTPFGVTKKTCPASRIARVSIRKNDRLAPPTTHVVIEAARQHPAVLEVVVALRRIFGRVGKRPCGGQLRDEGALLGDGGSCSVAGARHGEAAVRDVGPSGALSVLVHAKSFRTIQCLLG